MKLHITYNLPDTAQALKIAEQTADSADIIGVGSLLLLKDGIRSVAAFRAAFPNKIIFAEAHLVEKTEFAITMLAQAGANYISVLAGSLNNSIKKAVATAHRFDVKIALDLLNAPSVGQSAMDAKALGIDLLIVHRGPESSDPRELDADWHDARDNSPLPIFITGKIDASNFQEIVALKPHGIMVGAAVTKAESPAQAAQLFHGLLI